jgi:hypothetical protein
VNIVNLLLGLATMIAVPSFAAATGGEQLAHTLANEVICGLCIAVCSAWAMASRSARPYWIQVVLGVWLAASPTLLRYQDFDWGILDMGLGLLVGFLALMAAMIRTPGMRDRDPSI